MWYAIEGHDGLDVLPLRMQVRPEHLARLTALRDAGRLLLAGPCPAIDTEDPGPAGYSGSIVIAEFPSLEDARAWADADPYTLAGVYARIDVRAVPEDLALIPAVPLTREARVPAIRDALERAFSPTVLEVRDDSHRHAGHAGAQDGRGHFDVRIASTSFAGMTSLARHRAIYGALGDLMQTDIHALSIHVED